MIQKVGIIGCGKMAYALLSGMSPDILNSFSHIYACDIASDRLGLFQEEFGAIPVARDELIAQSDLILLSVKPQQIRQVLGGVQAQIDSSKLVVSIAAGIPIKNLQNNLGEKIPIIRVMPNTPCLVGEGVSAIAGGKYATAEDIKFTQSMFASLGMSMIVDESLLDAVTAVSGSGPAYVFVFVEAMIDAAVQVGLNANLAREMVLQTFRGGITMLEESKDHPAVFKQQVCSPAGTSIAGVRKLEENGIRKALFEAVDAAYKRSIELGHS